MEYKEAIESPKKISDENLALPKKNSNDDPVSFRKVCKTLIYLAVCLYINYLGLVVRKTVSLTLY